MTNTTLRHAMTNSLLSDRTALITGCGRGIGKAIALTLGRAGSPEDIVNPVKFLASDESAYITGQVISCNGGIYI